MEKFADLHIHTNYSDSTLTPQDVVRLAQAAGLSCIAISDHDTIEGIRPAMSEASRVGLEVLPGIELSSELQGKDIHMLGYCMNMDDETFGRKISSMQNTRVERMQKMIDKLKPFGIKDISLDEVSVQAQTDSVGRPHLAAVLVEKGHVRDFSQAFDKYLDEKAPAYVPKFKQTPFDAIRSIKEAGGVAVLAHPMMTQVDELIPQMVEAGLDGLEVFYPYVSPKIMSYYMGLAEKHGLVLTGGSDAHGDAKKNIYIGMVKLPYAHVENLKKRITLL